MSTEPKLAVEAVLDSDQSVAGITVRKITAGRYAWLERLDSPFTDFEKKFTLDNLIPSLYVIQLETEKLRQYSCRDVDKLKDDAFAWADEIDLDKIGPAVDVVMDQFRDILKISPGTGQDGPQGNGQAGATITASSPA